MKRSAFLALLATLLTATIAFAAPVGPSRAEIIVFSDSAPNISVIDGQTHQVIRTANVPGLRAWGYNDANNYFDGKNLWVGMVNPDTRERIIGILDMDSLMITRRISLGTDGWGIFIGRLSARTGTVFVAKGLERKLYSIDPKTYQIVRTVDLPIPEAAGPPPSVACDVDPAVGFDGRERLYVPALSGNMLVSVDTSTMAVNQVRLEGRPWMATPTPDGRRLWIQEQAGNSNVIVSTIGMQMVDRIPAGRTPIMGTFTPDGRLHITGHVADVIVIANNAETFQEAWRAQVGMSPAFVGVHPAGTFVYAAITREGAVAVLDASTGRLVTRVALGTNPWGLFVRSMN